MREKRQGFLGEVKNNTIIYLKSQNFKDTPTLFICILVSH